MKEYGGYPDRWLEQDWALIQQLLTVNSIIQKIQKREQKKKNSKQKRQSNRSRKGRRR